MGKFETSRYICYILYAVILGYIVVTIIFSLYNYCICTVEIKLNNISKGFLLFMNTLNF